jgi:hypothetical protein
MVNKLLSGRYFLTVIAGIAFAYCVITKTMSDGAIVAIIMSVFKDYFNRQRKGE